MQTDIIETTRVGDVTVVHTVKPKKSISDMHDQTATSPKRMKAFRKTQTSACSFCHKLQTDKLVCAKCKVAAYCSKECQRKQWPSHKLVCHDSKAAAKLKLVHAFAASPYASRILADTFSLAFNFHDKIILDRPLIARCDLAVDAADLSIIFGLTSGKQTPENYPNGVEGMIQIKSFIPIDSTVAIDAGRRKIWEQARAKNQGLRHGPVGKNPTGLIDFHLEGTDQVITIPLNIDDGSISSGRFIALIAGTSLKYLPMRQEMHIPFTLQSSVRSVNMNILNDEKNLLKLRTHMPKEALYKYVGSNVNRHHLEMLPTTTNVTRGGEEVRLAPLVPLYATVDSMLDNKRS